MDVLQAAAAFIKKKNNALLLLALLGAAVLLVLLGIPDARAAPAAQGAADTAQALQNILQRVQGAGKVQVYITYADDGQVRTAVDEQVQTAADGSCTVRRSTVQTGGEALVLATESPQICGVLVVAQGAKELQVRLWLQQAVQTVLQIAPTQIEILPMDN